MNMVDQRDTGQRAITDMDMTLIDQSGHRRIRKMRSFRKEEKDLTRTLMFFRFPSDVKNTGFLTYDYDLPSKVDDQWLYLPALRKVKRIASTEKSRSFMGSDFSYADLTSRALADYDFSLMKESAVRGNKVWQILAKPRNKRVIKETGYVKTILFVRQDNYVVVRAVNWTETGQKLKYFDIKSLSEIDGIWTSLEIHMTTKKGKRTLHKTILKQSNIHYNSDFDPRLFAVGRLSKGL